MQAGRVIGSATATVRHPSMKGWKLLVVQPMTSDGMAPDGDPCSLLTRADVEATVAIVARIGRGEVEEQAAIIAALQAGMDAVSAGSGERDATVGTPPPA